MGMGKSILHVCLLAGAVGMAAATSPVQAQSGASSRPFTALRSNAIPLAFGMDETATAKALGTKLTYVKGRRGNETFMVIRHVNGIGFLFREDPLYLQFRKGRLTGWKGDWSRRPWLWW